MRALLEGQTLIVCKKVIIFQTRGVRHTVIIITTLAVASVILYVTSFHWHEGFSPL